MRRLGLLAGAIVLAVTGAGAEETGPPLPPPSQNSVGVAHNCDRYQPADLSFGYDGRTTLRFNVMPTGYVSDIQIAKSSGNTELDNLAIDCVSHWKYKPATVDGRPIQKAWEAAVVWHILPRGTVIQKPAESHSATAPNPAPAK
jgi:TonB family protein